MSAETVRLLKERDEARAFADQWRNQAADSATAAARAEGEATALRLTVELLKTELTKAHEAMSAVSLAEQLGEAREQARQCMLADAKRPVMVVRGGGGDTRG